MRCLPIAWALPLKGQGFGKSCRQLVDKTTPAAADLKGARNVSSWQILLQKSGEREGKLP